MTGWELWFVKNLKQSGQGLIFRVLSLNYPGETEENPKILSQDIWSPDRDLYTRPPEYKGVKMCKLWPSCILVTILTHSHAQVWNVAMYFRTWHYDLISFRVVLQKGNNSVNLILRKEIPKFEFFIAVTFWVLTPVRNSRFIPTFRKKNILFPSSVMKIETVCFSETFVSTYCFCAWLYLATFGCCVDNISANK
jgi:hypothetical protein